jgi:hypothetical protein
VNAPRLTAIEVSSCALEVPLEDFDHLPRELGCSLHRRAEVLTLAADQPGCEMHFEVDGDAAFLSRIDLKDDAHGTFFRDVVGLMLQLYSGDLDAEMTWAPKSLHDSHIEVRQGETSHPLLFEALEAQPEAGAPAAIDTSLPLIEQWLADAREAWGEYQRLKQSREKQSQSLT